MATIGLEIEKITPDTQREEKQAATEAKKIVRLGALSTASEIALGDPESAFALAKLNNVETKLDHVQRLLANDTGLQRRVSYQWTTTPEFSDDREVNDSTQDDPDEGLSTVERALRPGTPGRNSVLLSREGDIRGGDVEIVNFFTENRGEEIAAIRLTDASGNPVQLSNEDVLFTNFLLQSVNEPRQEKYQIDNSGGKAYLRAFGSEQEIYTFNGILVDYANLPWRQEFIQLYEQDLRATRAIEEGYTVEIAYRGSIRRGHLLNCYIQHSVANLNHVVFTMKMFVTSKEDLPIDSSVSVADQQGIREADVKNNIVVRAPGVPFSVIQKIRNYVFDPETNSVRSGRAEGIWNHHGLEGT